MAIPKRVGNWAVTQPLGVGNLDFGAGGISLGSFTIPQTDNIATLTEWRTQGENPSGWRHRTEHPSFQRVLASGAGNVAASVQFQSFDLQSTDISTGSGVSQTKVMLFRIHKFTSPGITRVHNMKLWAPDTTDFLEPQTHKVLYRVSTPWTSGFVFEKGDLLNQDYWLPTSLPENQNLFRTGRIGDHLAFGQGFRTIVGSGDADVSQWIYMALGASGTMPLGEYGDTKDGPEGFVLRVTYNVDNLTRFHD